MPEFTRDVAFLLGAGTSIPSGYASTDSLTKMIMDGKDVIRHTDGCYYVADKSEAFPFDYVGAITKLLSELKIIADKSLIKVRGLESNYEDLLFLLVQLTDQLYGESENPAIEPFLSSVEPILIKYAHPIRSRVSSAAQMADEATNYIRDRVSSLLRLKPRSTEHLGRIFEPFLNGQQRCYIATLNHDTHLEDYLSSKASFFSDGFGCELAGVRYRIKSTSPIDDLGIQIFKLHGSVNWYTFRPDNGNFFDHKIGIPMDGDFWHTRGCTGELQMPVPPRPLMIMGTFNKFVDYHSSVFADIHAAWRAALERVDRLVISGYGFGDKGINSQVVEWAFNRRGRRILLISPDLQYLRDHARGAINRHWEKWLHSGVVECLEKGFEECTATELQKFSA